MPKISVIMPVYNTERYVAEAVESILQQTFADFEFLILNDGSTDRSAELLRQYAQSDPRIRLYDFKDNTGYLARLNQGIALSQGEYLARMDADDVSLPERFAKQVQFLATHPSVAAVGSSVYMLDASGREQANLFSVPGDLIQTRLFFGNYFFHSAMMGRTDIFRAYLYHPEYNLAEDYFLWSQISLKYEMFNLPEPLIKYRLHAENSSKKKQQLQRTSTKKVYRFYLERLGVTPLSDDELELHFEILNGRPLDWPLQYQALRWLNLLARLQRQRHVYQEDFFLAQLAGFFLRYLKRQVVCQAGIKALPFAWSPLAAKLHWRLKARYVIACLKHTFMGQGR